MKFPDPTVSRYGLGVVEFCFEGCEAEAEAECLSVAFAGEEFVLEDLVDVETKGDGHGARRTCWCFVFRKIRLGRRVLSGSRAEDVVAFVDQISSCARPVIW